MAHRECKECGTVTDGTRLCLYCRSKLTDCKFKTYKQLYCSVPWCLKYDKRILHCNCEECEDKSDEQFIQDER